MKRIFVLVIKIMIVSNIYGQSYYNKSTETVLEEQFVYGVSWSFFHLAALTLTVESVIADPDLKKITVDIKTESLLPFIDVDEYNEVVMRMRDGMTMNFYGTEELDGEKIEKYCNYYEDENLSVYEERNFESDELICSDTITYSKPYLIGSSLIHYTRLIADSGLVKNVPTMLGGDIYKTILNFCGPVEYIEIDEFDEPIITFKYEGSAEWDGKATAGLSGDFTGWLSDDDGSVVIRAEMKILLGSVVIELEEWYKPGWIPPTKTKLLTNNQ
jgi:hypothetical protein